MRLLGLGDCKHETAKDRLPMGNTYFSSIAEPAFFPTQHDFGCVYHEPIFVAYCRELEMVEEFIKERYGKIISLK